MVKRGGIIGDTSFYCQHWITYFVWGENIFLVQILMQIKNQTINNYA